MSVIEEGDPMHFFPKIVYKRSKKNSPNSASSESSPSTVTNHLAVDMSELPSHLCGEDNISMLDESIRDIKRQDCHELTKTIKHVRGLGLMVDDNNDALSENIPQTGDIPPSQNEDEAIHQIGQSWGCDGIDERKKAGVESGKAKLKHGMDEVSFDKISYLEMFLLFFHYV